ncbi:hypothetical protein BD413DRAFT_249953 [Trametes elegans]|nr:hypothetical protein BD413DRAFT_249953 [Trametes elegans]
MTSRHILSKLCTQTWGRLHCIVCQPCLVMAALSLSTCANLASQNTSNNSCGRMMTIKAACVLCVSAQ